MKVDSVKLVYFSPTGTTKRIVEGVACGINHGKGERIDITLEEGRSRQIHTMGNELLIMGVPVYFGRVPACAIEWLHTIKAHNTPAVCIVVYGNREYDDALLELKDCALGQGCRPIACAAFVGEHSFSGSGTPIAAGRPDARDLRYAEAFGERIKAKLEFTPTGIQCSDIAVPGNYPYKDMEEGKQRLSGVEFIAVSDRCSQCGVCARECPVGAIDPGNSGVTDSTKCIKCCACIKKCPSSSRTVSPGVVQSIAMRLSQACRVRKEPIYFL
jgi:ferredoxin